MSRYKLLVFDWDGTLMDSVAHIVASMRAAIRELNLPHRRDDELQNVIGLGLQEALATLYPEGSGLVLKDLVERYRYHYLHANSTPSQLFEGVEALLAELQARGYLMAIATGKGRAGLDSALPQVGVTHYFCTTRCAEETLSKPHPRMLLEIMAQMQVSPEETLMIGDTEYDMLMAQQAGADALAVSYGVHDKMRLQHCEPIGCVDSVEELHGWLLKPA